MTIRKFAQGRKLKMIIKIGLVLNEKINLVGNNR